MKQVGLNIAVIIICSFILGFIFGGWAGEFSMGEKAVEKGYAEYYFDENHDKQWRWLPIEKKEGED